MAWAALKAIVAHEDHVYWDDAFGYLDVRDRSIQGAKQVTDAWLAELARRRRGRVATLDAAFAALRPNLVQLVPGR